MAGPPGGRIRYDHRVISTPDGGATGVAVNDAARAA